MPGSVPLETVVQASATTVQLLPNRPSRRSMTIFNDSVEALYIRYGAGASLDEFLIKIPAGWYGRMPWGEVYTGIISGFWAGADPSGSAKITELIH